MKHLEVNNNFFLILPTVFNERLPTHESVGNSYHCNPVPYA